MNHDDVKQHWTNWANSYGASVRATTRGQSAKELELTALMRKIGQIRASDPDTTRMLEIGCGVGVNCVELVKRFPELSVTGLDYVPKMIDNAVEYRRSSGLGEYNPSYQVGDVLNLSFPKAAFDIVLSNRCLINLETSDLQFQALDQVLGCLRPNGHVVLIENSRLTHGNQNRLRQKLGLASRPEPEFNRFFDEDALLRYAGNRGLRVEETQNFSSFHDLILYVLIPFMNGGTVDYDHPAVAAATEISKMMAEDPTLAAGAFGQNKLFHFRKP